MDNEIILAIIILIISLTASALIILAVLLNRSTVRELQTQFELNELISKHNEFICEHDFYLKIKGNDNEEE
tara:strand:+ start:302 stop:514 length:213 start_codon:yes stop_codon:yes gene_type:complete